ncbi:uncharacterized protein TRIADDRAFT_55895 [Trichoplax adhaerens]|uniref:G-protein coupled receptors family 1 profile domain-containing protein n=1 Tax=Trichoplax adhaerens TaxID=10228 RepID=B3RW60_TRIAD|nr:hypothetical protein TRIADDRAFT_55895 [Trichoplax adhaerens]EDV26123.1 hypothetical protein TRIADDRAFT_55895 [Trichoplax adhaerens]|eukprot:XP_002112156.1 hypothetical protein TRIADDRAFT_55895 [Trichoplax adhaerens]
MVNSSPYIRCLDARFYLKMNLSFIVYPPPSQLKIDASIVWSILLTAILVINITLLGIICAKSSLRILNNILVGSLCIANILFCVFYILPAKVILIGNSIIPFTNIYCQLSHTVFQLAFFCCINFHISSISLDKLINVALPFWYDQNRKYKLIMFAAILFTCWVLPTFMAFLPFMISWWRICPYFCVISERKADRILNLTIWHTFWPIFMFLMPTVITVTFYGRIFTIARNHDRRLRAGSLPSSERRIITRSGVKAAKTVIIIVGVYLLFQMPYHIFQVINVLDRDLSRAANKYNLREWLLFLASCNSVFSPIIYGCHDLHLRNALKSLSCFKPLKKLWKASS